MPENNLPTDSELKIDDLFKNIDNIEYVIPYKYKSKGDYFSVFRMAKEIKKYNKKYRQFNTLSRP